MRYTVQYIPLSKIKSESIAKSTKRSKELRRVAQDCMQLLIVRKSRKVGGYVIISGINHLEYYKRYMKRNTAPCLVDEGKISSTFESLMSHFRKRKLPYELPYINTDHMAGNSLSIIRSFLKQNPRFKWLTRRKQLKVLRLGIQYKKTTIRSMNDKVDELLKR